MGGRGFLLCGGWCLLFVCAAVAQDAELPAGPLLRLPPVLEEDAGGPIEQLPLSPPAATAPAPQPADAASTESLPPGDKTAREVGAAIGDPGFWMSVWDPWDGNVELGLSGTDGNSETFNVRLGGNAKYKTETRVHSAQFVYIEKSAQGVQTAHSMFTDLRVEWPLANSPFNYFVHALVEYDQFKAFDWRFSGDTGIGYEFIQNDFTTLVARSGLAGSREVGGPDDKFNPELLFGLEFKHKFDDRQTISFKTDFYPTMTNFSDFRLNSQASWEMVVSKDWGLSLKLSVIDRYDSTPHSAKPGDLDYSTLLIWAF